MAAGRPGAWPRWRAHRLALDDPNDPNVDALRAHRLTRSMLAGWRPGACRLAGWRADGAALDSMGGEGRGDRPKKLWRVRKKFFIFMQKAPCLMPTGLGYAHCMSFQSLPFAPREIRATEKVLQAIYDAAKIGLKGDTLALAAGLLPTEYRRLCQLDPIAQMAEQKGRADGEAEAATQLHLAAKSGDTKASLAILTHVHGWVAKQQVQVDIKQQISITAALQEAESRVVAGRLGQDVRAPLTIEGEHATADL